MKMDSITDPATKDRLIKSKVKFGQYEGTELPTLYFYAEQVLDKRLTYSEVLEKNPGFGNPSNVEVVCEDLGLPNTVGQVSLFSSLCHQCGLFFFLLKFAIIGLFFRDAFFLF